ncbi:MAG: pyridoxamine kinase [Desulfovibrio sp.]|nr:pyridoxamine kinase [Desulfovibrio sp.]
MYPLTRICAIHDISGFGRASLSLVMPILTTMGIQVCPMPTAVLSSQTSGMTNFSFLDLTQEMRAFLHHWKSLGLAFDAVYSGFLGSPKQIEIAAETIHSCLLPHGFAFVDPVLGDNGVLDPTQTPELVDAQRHLVGLAKIIAPNLTEASFLLKEPFSDAISLSGLKDQLRGLAEMGPESVVITSAPASNPDLVSVVAFDSLANRFWRVQNRRFPAFYPGTGDTFSSVLLGALLQGESLPMAVTRASEFVMQGIIVTYGYGTPSVDGVLLEKVLPSLRSHTCSLFYEEI